MDVRSCDAIEDAARKVKAWGEIAAALSVYDGAVSVETLELMARRLDTCSHAIINAVNEKAPL